MAIDVYQSDVPVGEADEHWADSCGRMNAKACFTAPPDSAGPLHKAERGQFSAGQALQFRSRSGPRLTKADATSAGALGSAEAGEGGVSRSRLNHSVRMHGVAWLLYYRNQSIDSTIHSGKHCHPSD
jgi:hypothetical protein